MPGGGAGARLGDVASAQQTSEFERLTLVREHPDRIPRRDAEGFVTVDATSWGEVTPIRIAPGVETIGELELIEHLERGGALIDTRVPESVATGTIPGAEAIPSAEIAAHADRFSADEPVALFCNGPQCLATPQSIRALLDAGCEPEALLYYRGGLQNWVCLGYPLEVQGPD